MRHDDHNQSSRLDLDFDPDAASMNSSDRLTMIEDGSECETLGTAPSKISVSRAAQGQQHNNLNGSANNGQNINIKREATESTIEMSPTSSDEGEGSTNKKIFKVKLSDPGESSAEPTVVTLSMNMPQNQELDGIQKLNLGVGHEINLSRDPRRNSNGRTIPVGVTWKCAAQLPKKGGWEPPFAISEGDCKKEEDQNNGEDTSSKYQSPRKETTPSAASLPEAHVAETERHTNAAEEKKGEESDALPTPVKGLEPFTIPSILSSTIVKSSPSQKVGLAFRKATGTVVIEKIVPGSPFDGTAIRPGCELLSINGHRLRSARRAAEIVRESGSTLSLVASDAPRPPGTMYTTISLKEYVISAGEDYAAGMHFKMKHGLVQLVKVDAESPITATPMKVGDYVLAVNGSVAGGISKAVEILSSSNDDLVPILYFNMRQLRVSLVDKVIGDVWKKEWSEEYDECVVLQRGTENGSSHPLTLRFKEEGMCELLNTHGGDNEPTVVYPGHPLNSVVETLNHGIICVLSAIREGVELAAAPPTSEG